MLEYVINIFKKLVVIIHWMFNASPSIKTMFF